MMEFQITKEYLGFATHLAYLGADVGRGAGCGHAGEGHGIDGGQGRSTARCTATGTPAWPASPTSAPTATGAARISTRPTGTPSVASPGIPDAVVAAHRRRVGAHDVLERCRVRRAGGRDDDGLARGRGRLHDAARAGASDGHRPSLRPGALGERPVAAGMEPGLLPSRGCERHRLRARTPSKQQGQQRDRAVLAEGRGASSPIRRRRPKTCCCGSTTCPGITAWLPAAPCGTNWCSATTTASR